MSWFGTVRRASIQTQMRLLLLLAVAPILLFLGVFAVVRENSIIKRAFQQKAERLVNLLAYNLAPGVEFEDVKALTEVVAGFTRGGEVSYVVVGDTMGRTLCSYMPSFAPTDLFSETRSETRSETDIESKNDGNILHLRVPLIFNRRLLGTMTIGFSLERINEELFFNFLMVLVTVLVTVVVIVSATRHFTRLITVPIETLKATAENISRGDFDAPLVKIEAAQELEFLHATFNQMVQAIRQKQRELNEFNQTLESKVQERTYELEVQTAKSQLSDRLKSEFLSNMSHELRTPLTSILAWPDFICDHYERREEVLLGAREIKKTATHLLRLINDLLDLESIDAGRLRVDLQSVDPGSLVNEAVQHLAGFALTRQVNIEVEISDLPRLMLDPTRFKQVIINLLSNAIKFSQGGKTVRVSAKLNGGGNDVAFSVTDKGLGIAAEDLPVIFERFRQVDGSIRRKFGGSGIGLYLVRRLSELMRGHVRVESRLGEGSSFFVDFPIPTTSDSQVTSFPTDPLAGKLVVEAPK
ncbi:MAG: HAMP domain-containing sensor histidine kinase [Candidatus Ozemobacteraceae bacterium]